MTGAEGVGPFDVDSPYDDAEERLALARTEQAAAASAGRHSPVPAVDLGHLPAPIRIATGKVSDWLVNATVHAPFARFCRVTDNRKTETTKELVDKERDISFVCYFESLHHC